MEEQAKKMGRDLLASRSWLTWFLAGLLCLVAVFLRPLLFILAFVFFVRALILAWPEIEKKLKDSGNI